MSLGHVSQVASQGVLVVKNPPATAGDIRYVGLILDQEDPLEEGMHEHMDSLQCSCLEKPHGQRSLAGYSPRGRKESDTTEASQH